MDDFIKQRKAEITKKYKRAMRHELLEMLEWFDEVCKDPDAIPEVQLAVLKTVYFTFDTNVTNLNKQYIKDIVNAEKEEI